VPGTPGPTLEALTAELGQRLGDYILCLAAGTGSTTTLVSTDLQNYAPQSIQQCAFWAYGASSALGTSNVGVIRRAASYDAPSAKLTFAVPWPAAIVGGAYHIHMRMAPDRKIAAINAAVRLLPRGWPRNVVDEVSLTTAPGQLQYTLSSNVRWDAIQDLEIQVATDPDFATHGYQDARIYDWRIYPITAGEDAGASAGLTTWRLQFGREPPPGRKLRVFGSAFYPDLQTAGSYLAIGERDQGPALEWLYDYAEYKLWQWQAAGAPSYESLRYGQAWEKRLAVALQDLQTWGRGHRTRRVGVPGFGTGQAPLNSPDDTLIVYPPG